MEYLVVTQVVDMYAQLGKKPDDAEVATRLWRRRVQPSDVARLLLSFRNRVREGAVDA